MNRRRDVDISVVLESHQATVEHPVKGRSEHKAVEAIKALFVLRAPVPWANVTGDEEPAVLDTCDPTFCLDTQYLFTKPTLATPR